MFDVCRLCLSDIPEIRNKLSHDDYTSYDTKIKLLMPEIVSFILLQLLKFIQQLSCRIQQQLLHSFYVNCVRNH